MKNVLYKPFGCLPCQKHKDQDVDNPVKIKSHGNIMMSSQLNFKSIIAKVFNIN